jgi:hypothetical protein
MERGRLLNTEHVEDDDWDDDDEVRKSSGPHSRRAVQNMLTRRNAFVVVIFFLLYYLKMLPTSVPKLTWPSFASSTVPQPYEAKRTKKGDSDEEIVVCFTATRAPVPAHTRTPHTRCVAHAFGAAIMVHASCMQQCAISQRIEQPWILYPWIRGSIHTLSRQCQLPSGCLPAHTSCKMPDA